MSLAKVIEVIGEGDTMEGAVQNVATEASKTVDNIKSIYCESIQAIVENNSVTKYRVNAKVTFVVGKKG
ncbi:dodecin family protein [Halalkalibaculum sp. DA3122]|uniref:dodecin family protein n=1 Tax=Halalkalibaculum sp. DA3122 TaxID=3373607 RepID=UPI0037545D6A